MESLVYVTNVSHLLYAATLLDTFLSETIQFLFLLIPRAMGEGQPVPLRALIDAPSKNEAITQAAFARTREIRAIGPLLNEFSSFGEIFGLEITLTADTTDGLARFSSVRDQSGPHPIRRRFPLQLDGRGRREVEKKRHLASQLLHARCGSPHSEKIGCRRSTVGHRQL